MASSSHTEAGRHGIRVVPYSPPKPAEETEPARDIAYKTPTRPRFTPVSYEPSSSSPPGSAASSAASSELSLPGTGTRIVSAKRLGSVSDAAESTLSLLAPVARRASHSSSHSSQLTPSPLTTRFDQPLSQSSSAATIMSPKSRRGNIIEVNPDKTFSVVLRSARPSNVTTHTTASSATTTSAPFTTSSSLLSSSYEPVSFDATHHDVAPSSPLSSVPERESPQVSPRSSAIIEPESREADVSSPWNYRMTGGVRKVPATPEPRRRGVESAALPDVDSETETAGLTRRSQNLEAKASFSSQDTDSSLDEDTNLRVIGHSSPIIPYSSSNVVSSAPSEANVQILGVSSPVYPSSPARATDILDTPGSRNFVIHNNNHPVRPSANLFTPRGSVTLESPGSKNFVVHGQQGTPASWLQTPYAESAGLDTPGSRNFVTHGPISRQSSVGTFPRHQPSIDTLPRHQPSIDSMAGFVREQYSQESLKVSPLNTRRKSSQDRLDYSRQIPREALRPRAASFSSISSVISQEPSAARDRDVSAASSGTSWINPFSSKKNRVEAQPHVWSSGLSTVMSEDERSEGSRIASQLSERSNSAHSRYLLSASSLMSLSEIDEARSRGTQSRLDMERPSPAYLPSPVIRMIRDHDEDGDGLADLEQANQLRHKSSWTKVGGYLTRRSSDRELHSSASSRHNSMSISASTIPYWAKVYYGSGERRWLAAPSIRSQPSVQSFAGAESRRASVVGRGTSMNEDYENDIYNPRRRPRDGVFRSSRDSRPDSMQISQAPSLSAIRRMRKKTSSIWSPHLHVDRRSTLYSAWAPPAVNWSTDGGLTGRRNIQIVLFALGFIFPFGWMIAAFLPLPRPSNRNGFSQDNSHTELGVPNYEKASNGQYFAFDDARYQNARWWRNVNRVMSIIGILVLGAIIALIIIGIKDKWVK